MSNMKSALVGYPSGQDEPIPPDGIARSGLPAGFDPAQGKEVCVTDLNSSKFWDHVGHRVAKSGRR